MRCRSLKCAFRRGGRQTRRPAPHGGPASAALAPAAPGTGIPYPGRSWSSPAPTCEERELGDRGERVRQRGKEPSEGIRLEEPCADRIRVELRERLKCALSRGELHTARLGNRRRPPARSHVEQFAVLVGHKGAQSMLVSEKPPQTLVFDPILSKLRLQPEERPTAVRAHHRLLCHDDDLVPNVQQAAAATSPASLLPRLSTGGRGQPWRNAKPVRVLQNAGGPQALVQNHP